jgi:hypothetical protein
VESWYFWAVAIGSLGVFSILSAAVISLVGLVRREPLAMLPPYTGWAFGLMVGGCLSFVTSLLIMAAGGP